MCIQDLLTGQGELSTNQNPQVLQREKGPARGSCETPSMPAVKTMSLQTWGQGRRAGKGGPTLSPRAPRRASVPTLHYHGLGDCVLLDSSPISTRGSSGRGRPGGKGRPGTACRGTALEPGHRRGKPPEALRLRSLQHWPPRSGPRRSGQGGQRPWVLLHTARRSPSAGGHTATD